MTEVSIELINIDDMMVLLDDGRMLPITHTFDGDGDECDAESAMSIVAGTDDDGWVSIDMTEFEPATIH